MKEINQAEHQLYGSHATRKTENKFLIIKNENNNKTCMNTQSTGHLPIIEKLTCAFLLLVFFCNNKKKNKKGEKMLE